MRSVIAVFLCVISSLIEAQDLYMVRSEQSFPEAMTVLQEAIKAKGYTVSRVQRVDIGLTASGYQTDKYRLVFFGKLEEVRDISARHISLVPYMPLKIAIFAEGENTILLASSFRNLKDNFDDAHLLERFAQWEIDLADILEMVRVAK